MFEKFFANLILKRLHKWLDNFLKEELKMEGWKTKLGGVGTILSGLAILAGVLSGDSVNINQLAEAALVVFAGLGAIGLGHKLDKVKGVLEKLK